MTSRPPPVPPNRNVPNNEQVQTGRPAARPRVEKTSKVDEDRAQNRKFRDMVDQPEEETAQQPTPFDLFNSTSTSADAVDSSPTDSSLQDALNETAVPSASYSPPPAQILAGTTGTESAEDSALPQSNIVWSRLDEPPSATEQELSFEETALSASRNTDSSSQTDTENQEEQNGPLAQTNLEKQKKPLHPKSAKAISPLEEAEKLKTRAEDRSSSSKIDKKKEPPHALPQSTSSLQKESSKEPRFGKTEEMLENAQSSKTQHTHEAKQTEASLQAHADTVHKKAQRTEKELVSMSHKEKEGGAREDWDKKKGTAKEKASQMQLAHASLTPIDPNALPIAQAAAAAAAPYLGPEALAIYFHMIGSIVAMTKPSGDSRTEILLNAPSFAQSKFYGSKIIIERFSTAPYMLNIRLGGATETAVKEFQQNIPNLLAVFRRGNFSFAINRIEAVYEKPLFHRKDAARDKGSSSDFSEGK